MELNFPSKCGIIHSERGNENETKARTFRKAILRTSAKWSDVIQENGKKNGRTAWLCKCDCGNEIIAKKIYVMRGEVKSCGCISIAKEGSSEELEIKNYILSLNKNIKIEKKQEKFLMVKK